MRQFMGLVAGLMSLFCLFGIAYSAWKASSIRGNDPYGELALILIVLCAVTSYIYDTNIDGPRSYE
jgi:hypothetical protein